MTAFVLNPDNGRPAVLANLTRHLAGLDQSKRWRVTVELERKTRTDKQNAGLFGVIYPPLMAFMGLQGESDKEQLHHHFCCEFFGTQDNQFGVRIPIRTTTKNEAGKRDVVDWQTFSDFVAFIQRQGAEYGVYIPDPDPLWREGK